MAELPNTVIECDGCGKELNILAPYLSVGIKAQRNVLLIQTETSEDPNEVPDDAVLLGAKKGRGRMMKMHGFDCLALYAKEREGQVAKLVLHSEDEIYVPDDNPTEKEIAARERKALKEAERSEG